MAKITVETIQEILNEYNWKIISTEYENLMSMLEFECEEGHRVFMNWGKLRNKIRCPVCALNYYKEQDNKVISKPKDATRYLAIDQSTKLSGWAVYDNNALIKYGFFETTKYDEIDRNAAVKNWIVGMVNSWQPDYVGLEDIQLQQFNKNKPTNGEEIGVQMFKTLAHLQGILLLTLYELKCKYIVLAPATWRAHCQVRGRTRADKKRSMQLKVKEWFDVQVSNDEADAIGIGKCMSEILNKQTEIVDWE